MKHNPKIKTSEQIVNIYNSIRDGIDHCYSMETNLRDMIINLLTQFSWESPVYFINIPDQVVDHYCLTVEPGGGVWMQVCDEMYIVGDSAVMTDYRDIQVVSLHYDPSKGLPVMCCDDPDEPNQNKAVSITVDRLNTYELMIMYNVVEAMTNKSNGYYGRTNI